MVELTQDYIRRRVAEALAEDRADSDVTTSATVPRSQRGRASMQAKAHGVLAGLGFARATFEVIDPGLRWAALAADGEGVSPGRVVATVEGSLASILRAERVALNYACHLSGIATQAADVVRQLEGTQCRLRDTRKTIPGLRLAEKYAARMGGAESHRLDLADGVLVKDNHIAALRARDLGIGDAVRLCRDHAASGLKIEIEVTSLAEARAAAEAGADELLLDNMTPEECATVVRDLESRGERPILEASGGITPDNVRPYARSGVDYISMGWVTHSAPALDLSLEVEPG